LATSIFSYFFAHWSPILQHKKTNECVKSSWWWVVGQAPAHVEASYAGYLAALKVWVGGWVGGVESEFSDQLVFGQAKQF
jgi:hypothetical protein